MNTLKLLHRWFSWPLAFFFLMIALSGIGLQISELGESHDRPRGGPPAQTTPSEGVIEPTAAVSQVGTVLQAIAKTNPTAAPRDLRLLVAGGKTVADVTLGSGANDVHRYDAATGAELPRPQAGPGGPGGDRGGPGGPGGPDGGFNLHGILINIHKGSILGLVGSLISLLCGVALTLLSVTGFFIWWKMYRARSRNGRRNLFW